MKGVPKSMEALALLWKHWLAPENKFVGPDSRIHTDAGICCCLQFGDFYGLWR
jgi:hypothetical protein